MLTSIDELGPVRIEASHLSDRQLLQQILVMQHNTIHAVMTLEDRVANLTEAVDQLRGAVDGVAQRMLPRLLEAESALAETQALLENALADDEEAARLFESVTQAVFDIHTEVDRLNALGTDPSTPVDVDAEPTDPPDVEVPSNPNEDSGGEGEGEGELPEPGGEDTPGDEGEDPAAV